MFPLWDVAIAPVLRAAGARKVVEIGALRGDNTVQILDHLGPQGVLHVIDPVPDFDPEEHEREFPGRYVFHRALSLDVLPELEGMDAALIDGDHNWWTVYNECTMLAASAQRDGLPMPVLILHDVCWPYGRRDLYYDPSNVPAEHRQPFDYKGMKPGQARLANRGGLNATMANAIMEGGDRNGVMTGVDDFVAEYPKPLRQVVLPLYFGLALLVEEERLAAEPELAAAFDRLESADGRLEMVEVAESIRLRAMMHRHNISQREQFVERSAQRYLRVVKKALLNEYYLENEVRLDRLVGHISSGGGNLDVAALRDPVRYDTTRMNALMRSRSGEAGPHAAEGRSFVPYTAMGRRRIDDLEARLDAVRATGVAGDLVEVGTGRGGGAIFMRAYLEAHEDDDRRVWVADRFRSAPEGSTKPTLPARGISGFQADLNMVRDGFARFDLLDDRVSFLTGRFRSTLPDAPISHVALLHIGQGAGDQAAVALEALYDRVSPGGVVIIDERAHSSVQSAIERFRADRAIAAPLVRIDDSTVTWVKSADDSVDVDPAPAAPGALPLLATESTDDVDLTVVVVFHNMRREAERTLRSLSRSYQQSIDELSYEVIAIDNGSSPDQRLDEEFVRGFGPEFRFIDMGDDAPSTPIPALNRGIAEGRGANFALMIDGAHVLTPGVFRFAMSALREYAPSIVATQQWYVGPGQQGEAMQDGYDQDYEDELFERIRWPHSGYRLFEIGSFVGERDWFDGMWESNCMFVSRTQLQQVGGFDEGFDEAGGGYANLELYERLGGSPDVTVCSIIGEGSFHQLHGGTTTNQLDAVERRLRIRGYAENYAELRGRPFKGPGKPLHFVGRFPNDAARRTKSRRLGAKSFAVDDRDDMPSKPMPMPDDLEAEFTEAVWKTLPWRSTSWLGHPIESAPSDLLAYQEIISSVRPDFVIETGSGGGRTLFLASMCELVGHGRVLALGAPASARPAHDRIEYVNGDPTEAETSRTVVARVGDGRTLVVLGARADRVTTWREFGWYEGLVPVGSYVIVTDTIVNGRPVWPAFGPGPGEAVKQILGERGDFVADPSREKYGLTFNAGGFLQRVR